MDLQAVRDAQLVVPSGLALLEEVLLAAPAQRSCPGLTTLSVQVDVVSEHIHTLAHIVARRASDRLPLSHLVVDRVPVLSAEPDAQPPPGDLDARVWDAVRRALSAAGAGAHVGRLEVGEGGLCRWEEPRGWDVPNPYWRLPVGDEPRAAFPWRSA